MLKGFLGKTSEQRAANAAVPEGVRVYAVGDIHGRIDLLVDVQRQILDDANRSPAPASPIVVYLGDYIDRGLNSREVIDRLIDSPLPGFETVTLRGNHDQFLLDFLDNPACGEAWLKYGGDATLYSYGVLPPADFAAADSLASLRDQLLEAVPARHVSFLANCQLAYESGDYLFVHAGVDPAKSLARQNARDLMWIRDKFLKHDADLGKVVVHGHSVSDQPDIRGNRIGIDTGACYSNRLTCLVLEGRARRFLTTGA